MLCPKCNTQLPDGSKFCGKCGNRIQIENNSQVKSPAQVESQTQPQVKAPQPQHSQAPVQAPVQSQQYSQAPVQSPVQSQQYSQAPVQSPVQSQQHSQAPVQSPVQSQQYSQAPVQSPVQSQQYSQAPVQSPVQSQQYSQAPVQAPVQSQQYSQAPVQPQPQQQYYSQSQAQTPLGMMPGSSVGYGNSYLPVCKCCGNILTDPRVYFCENCGTPIYGKAPTPKDPSKSLRSEWKKSTSGKKFSFKSDEKHWSPASAVGSLSTKNKCVLIAAATLIVCILVMIPLIANSIYLQTPAGMLSIGSRYLLDMEYEQALVQFDKVLEIDPKNVGAYINKAKTKLALGDIDGALDILHDGYIATNSQEIQDLIDEYESLSYGIMTGRINTPSGDILTRVNVVATKIADSSALNYSEQGFDAGEDIGKEYSAHTNSTGFWSLSLPRGLYSVEFEKYGYTSSAIYCEINAGQVVDTEQITMYDDSYRSAKMPIQGKVTNGLNYQPVSNAKIRFRSGWNNTTGDYAEIYTSTDSNGYFSGSADVVEYVLTDSSGFFHAVLPCGTYTAEITKDDFNTSYMNVSTSEKTEAQLLLTPHLGDNSYRIILTWGETPSDLDSHLEGEYDGISFNVFYRNKEFNDSVMLDVDDTTSFGPETITINYDSLMGDCRYYVHDYTNSGNSSSKALSNSNARVIVYKGNNKIGDFAVRPGNAGTIWNVFSIIDGELIVEDTYS